MSTTSPIVFDHALRRLVDGAAELGLEASLVALSSNLSVEKGRISIADEEAVRNAVGDIAHISALGSPLQRLCAHRVIWELAGALGAIPSSIDRLYRAIGKGDISPELTVPAVNMRALAYHSARGVFRAMAERRTGTLIFEISRGEIGFTGQRPHEYATSILAAAIKEDYRGPIFLQGDHFQISASRYHANQEEETVALESLMTEAVAAGFFNIDIDASTLVDLSHQSVGEQQALNCRWSAHFADHIRALQPADITISLGGEIGEVGEHNSTPDEVRAYLGGIRALLAKGTAGLTKLSIQSGTKHGGNVLADGSVGDMPIDFDLIAELSSICREEHSLGGCVQHGASMLSMSKIAQLPTARCLEVHLAAAFLNAVYDNLPSTLVEEADAWAIENFSSEWQQDWSRYQFLHHARRYCIGPFKPAWWNERRCHEAVSNAVCALAGAYIDALGAADTETLVAKCVPSAMPVWQMPSAAMDTENERNISDLAS